MVKVARPSTSAGVSPASASAARDGLDRRAAARSGRLLGELGGADAGDRGLAARGALIGATTCTVPVTWSPSETRPTTSIVATPSVDSPSTVAGEASACRTGSAGAPSRIATPLMLGVAARPSR